MALNSGCYLTCSSVLYFCLPLQKLLTPLTASLFPNVSDYNAAQELSQLKLAEQRLQTSPF